VTAPELRRVDPHGPQATALTREFFAAVAARYPDFDPGRQPPAPLEAFTAERGGAFLVASVDGALAGCGGVQRLDETTAEIRRVFVREAARRRGVARALVEGLLAVARELGYARVRLDTGDRLREARALFSALGFRDIGDYNGNPFAAYWMELEL